MHIAHGTNRFSEDLDFDNRGVSQSDFRQLTQSIARILSLEGFIVETSVSFKAAYTANIKIIGILFKTGLSGHKEEKVLIKIDAEKQNFKYAPQRIIINKFDVVSGINIVPADILLAQKFFAILMRKRAMGRDFYDAMFLAGKVKPNFGYLKAKAGIKDMTMLKSSLAKHCSNLNFKQLARDTAALLFVAKDAEKIALFPEFILNLPDEG